MSLADNIFIDMCKDILENGTSTEGGSIGKAYGYQMGVKHQYKEGMMDHDQSLCASGPA